MTAVAVNENAAEIAVVSEPVIGDLAADIRNLGKGGSVFYSSLRLNSFDDALAVTEALMDSKPISEHLNKTIVVKDIVVQAVAMVDEKTGEIRNAPRVVLIEPKGTAYHAISNGLYLSVKNLLLVLGEPAGWERPVPLRVIQEGKAPNAYFTARAAERK